ncbi:MAG: hypothetical protein K1X75_04805 [Leptospirales bacterium]|nr:hypothetical protein [Leptospirales bacterium]
MTESGSQHPIAPGRALQRLAGRLATAALIAVSSSGCLMVKRGLRDSESLLLGLFGFAMLYAGLRFLMARFGKSQTEPAWLRAIGGVVAGVLIFLA